MTITADMTPEQQVREVVFRFFRVVADAKANGIKLSHDGKFTAKFPQRLYDKLVDDWALARDGGNAPDIFWMDDLDDLGLAQAMHHFYAE